MVSILPAHLALEMKTEMIAKVRKAHMRSPVTNSDSNSKSSANKLNSSFKINNETSKRTDLKTSVSLVMSSTAQKINLKFAKSTANSNSTSTNNQTNLVNGTRKKSDHYYINDRTRSKSSAFHDLHIKTHNNVRYLTVFLHLKVNSLNKKFSSKYFVC